MHKSLNEFEIRPDPTTGFHCNRYCYNLKNGVATFSRLFLMGFFSYLQVMMTNMRAWMSSKFGEIRPLVSMATDMVIMAKQCHHFLSAVFHPILFIHADNNDMHENLENIEIWPFPNTDWEVSCP